MNPIGKLLGRDAGGFAHATLKEAQDFTESFSEVNTLAHRLLEDIEIDDTRALSLCALFARLLEASEAVACLSAFGYQQEAAIILRVSLETFFKLAAVCEAPELAQRALNADLIEERKIIDAALKRNSAGSRTAEELRAAEQRRDQLKALEDDGVIQSIDMRSLAAKVNQVDLYDTVSRMTSRYVHPSGRALEEYVVRREDGTPETIRLGPSSANFQMYVHTVLDFVLKGMTYLGKSLSLEAPEGYEAIVERYKQLQPKWPDEQREA